MSDNYYWKITWASALVKEDKGTVGHSDADETLTRKESWHSQTGNVDFKMYDDDGEHYYSGVIFGEYGGFEPLDDFGMPNAGCTWIEYRNKETHEWERL